MNLLDIRTRVFAELDWAPSQSPDAITRYNNFINRAYAIMAQEVPFLFFEDTVRFATLPDFKGQTGLTAAALDDTVQVNGADPWVLDRALPNSTAGLTLWDESGYWDSRMIELSAPDGRIHRHRIRDIWTDDTGTPRQHISLYRPWHNTTDTGITYRIYNHTYSLPDDVIEVRSLRLAESNQNWPLDIVGEMDAEQFSFDDLPSTVASGIPRTAFRRGHFSLPAPTEAPTAVAGELPGFPWQGPEPAGQFSYCYTYVWGYRDDEIQNFGPSGSILTSTSAFPEPRWESPPSPVSPAITAANGSGGAATAANVRVTMPNFGFMQGFGRNGTVRYQHAGFRKRIYRRRHTVESANYATPPLVTIDAGGTQIETPDAYFLIAEVEDWVLNWDDDGLQSPDYHRRLRPVHGYQTVAFHPRPDKRYELDCRCLRKPPRLEDDADAPRLHEEIAETLLISRTLVFAYEALGDPARAQLAMARYEGELADVRKRYGTLRPSSRGVVTRFARASPRYRRRRPFRRWWRSN